MLRRSLTVLEPFFADWLKFMLRLFLYVAVGLFLIHASVAVLFSYSLDYGEAPLVNQAMRLVNGKNIYRADISSPPYAISNYPPLYVLTMAPFAKLFGPGFLAGRVISVLCTLAAATFLALIIYTFAQDRVAAVTTGLLFLAIPFVVYWSPLARVDMLALAFSTAGLYVLTRWPTAGLGRVVGALLLGAAIYTRQSYALAAPLAAFVWLWTHDRRRAIELALLAGGTVLVLFIVLNVVTRGGFLYNIVTANVNEFSFERLGDWLKELGKTVPILLFLGGLFLFLAPARRMRAWPLLVPYLIGAFISALTIGKIGSNKNYFLELGAALSLVTGVFIIWTRHHPWRYCGLLLLLTLQTGWLMSETLDGPVRYLAFRVRDPRTLKELRGMVADADGPVLADEQMGMLTLQGRPLYMQPFEVTQLADAGLWDQTPLLRDIENHEFPLILVYQFPFGSVEQSKRWTPEMLSAIDEHYASVGNMDGNMVYRPKGWREAAEAPPPAQREAFVPTEMRLAAPRPVEHSELDAASLPPYLFGPHIAINPLQPLKGGHLAVTVARAGDFTCTPPDCQVNLLLYTSTDGGVTWTEQMPLDQYGRKFGEGMASFGPDGTLYTLGLHDRMGVNRSYADNELLPYRLVPTSAVFIPSSQVYLGPWLEVDPRDGELFVAYSGRYKSNLGVNLKRSPAAGDEWTFAVSVAEGVPLADISAGQATPPLGPQLVLGQGDDLAVAWAWGPGYWKWPLGVWIATSDDGGLSFSPAQQIAQTWSIVTAVSRNGLYYVFYRWGTEQEQQLVEAISGDGGATWETVSLSGGLPVYSDPLKGPGVDVAPDGTVDVVFYAHSQDAPACAFELEAWRQVFFGGTWTDPCVYDVYYTFSEDGGQTFSVPKRLNTEPIRGERFVRVQGFSFAGFRLAVASTDEYAYPVWVETQGEEGTQVFTVRVER